MRALGEQTGSHGIPSEVEWRPSQVKRIQAGQAPLAAHSENRRSAQSRRYKFYLNRYRAVVWLYLAEELRQFAEELRGIFMQVRCHTGERCFTLWERPVGE